jgi:hypothetical protein
MRSPLRIVAPALVAAALGGCTSNPTSPPNQLIIEPTFTQAVAAIPAVEEITTQTTASDTTGGGQREGSGGFGSGH